MHITGNFTSWLGHASLQSTGQYRRVGPANKLDILSERQPPSLPEGYFDGFRDELLAMLEDVAGR